MNKEQSNQMFGVDNISDWLNDIYCSHTFALEGKAAVAISLLSDVQELLTDTGFTHTRTAINRIKYLLNLDPDEELERRIISKLMRYLKSKGFEITCVIDEEEYYKTNDPVTAMGHIFAVEEASLRVRKEGFTEHGILLIPGNGEDIIADYNYSRDDTDEFENTMKNFEPVKE